MKNKCYRSYDKYRLKFEKKNVPENPEELKVVYSPQQTRITAVRWVHKYCITLKT